VFRLLLPLQRRGVSQGTVSLTEGRNADVACDNHDRRRPQLPRRIYDGTRLCQPVRGDPRPGPLGTLAVKPRKRTRLQSRRNTELCLRSRGTRTAKTPDLGLSRPSRPWTSHAPRSPRPSCLEVTVLRGSSAKVKTLADHVIAAACVMATSLTCRPMRAPVRTATKMNRATIPAAS
jgi:hypothetical protein